MTETEEALFIWYESFETERLEQLHDGFKDLSSRETESAEAKASYLRAYRWVTAILVARKHDLINADGTGKTVTFWYCKRCGGLQMEPELFLHTRCVES